MAQMAKMQNTASAFQAQHASALPVPDLIDPLPYAFRLTPPHRNLHHSSGEAAACLPCGVFLITGMAAVSKNWYSVAAGTRMVPAASASPG